MNDSLLDALAKPPPPPSELDELMSRDPLSLSAKDIDAIIAMQRQYRARKEGGGRKKKGDNEPTVSIDLASLGLVKPKEVPTLPSPTGGGFKRRI
jgi:hypothetical protein